MSKPTSFPIEKDYFDGARRVTRESELIAADPTKPHLADLLNQTVDHFDSEGQGFAGDIATNAANIATNAGNIATNSADIATNTSDIATNTADIATNTSDIATNAANIATNAADIATNAADIATNAAAIAAAGGLGAGVILRVSSGGKTVHASIADAMSGAVSGDVVVLGSGTYAESFTVPAGVCLMGLYGPTQTSITGTLATGDRVTLNAGSTVWGVRVDLPTDSAAGVRYSATGTAIAKEVETTGNGGAGIAVWVDGTGTLSCVDVRHISGDAENVFRVDSGGLNCGSEYPVISGGTVNRIFNLVGGTTSIGDVRMVPTGATRAFSVDAATLGGSVCSVENVSTAMQVTSASANVELNGMRAGDSVTTHLVIDSGFGTSPRVHLISSELDRNKITYDASYDDVIVIFQDDLENDRGFVIQGELAVGRPEEGSEAVFGEGDSYIKEIAVISSDSTATSTTEGGNLTDLTTAAGSPSGSTFSFQGTAANHTIMIGSKLDGLSDKLKHWGIKVLQTTAAVEVVKRSFAFELWDGAAWTEFTVMATEADAFHRYANEVFLRANSTEHIRFGVDDTTTWAKKLIGGQNLFWVRIRITDALTTAPVFEQFKLSPSRSEINKNGYLTHHGNARFKQAIVTGGNVFGESGGVANSSFAVGSGGVPTGWTFQSPNSRLNSDGDEVHKAIEIPEGVDTSFPIFIEMAIVPQNGTGADVDLIVSVLPQEVVGVLEADPTGGVTPVARTQVNTETLTSKAAQTDPQTVDLSTANLLYRFVFGPFDISDYYEGDSLFIRFELDDDGAGTVNVDLVTLAVNGVRWTPGARL